MKINKSSKDYLGHKPMNSVLFMLLIPAFLVFIMGEFTWWKMCEFGGETRRIGAAHGPFIFGMCALIGFCLFVIVQINAIH